MESDIKYLNEKQASAITGFALPTLRNHRHLGKGIPYVKAGKSVRYNQKDVVDYMERHKIETADSRG